MSIGAKTHRIMKWVRVADVLYAPGGQPPAEFEKFRERTPRRIRMVRGSYERYLSGERVAVFRWDGKVAVAFILEIGEEYISIPRGKEEQITAARDPLPEDVDEEAPIA